MPALKQKKEESVHHAVEKVKISDAAISQERMELISNYAKLPGGPASLKIGDGKAFQEFYDKSKDKALKPWLPNMLKEMKEEFDRCGEIPLSHFSELAKRNDVPPYVERLFLSELRSEAGITKEPFIPVDKRERDFFIGEAAYFSAVFRRDSSLRKQFLVALRYSNTPVKQRDLDEWYNTEGGKLYALGFSGEQRAMLLRCGLTAEWVKKLKLSKEEALANAEQNPQIWRDRPYRRFHYV